MITIDFDKNLTTITTNASREGSCSVASTHRPLKLGRLLGGVIFVQRYVTFLQLKSTILRTVRNHCLYIIQLQEKMASLKTDILTKKAGLFDNNHNVKAWKGNELSFYDEKIKQLVEMETNIATIYGKLQNLSIVLHKNIFQADIHMQEKKRKRKRTQKNRKKSEKEKQRRVLAKCHEVIKILSPDIAKSIDEESVLKGKPLELSIKPEDITDCNHSLSELFPRFHLDALNYLIEEGKVSLNSLPKVELIKGSLQKKLEETREKKASKIKKKEATQKQATIFTAFQRSFTKKEHDFSDSDSELT